MIALFFDTETTGFKSSTYTPRIVQLGAVLQDTETKRILQEYNTMIITDGFEIPEHVAAIHGVTNPLADTFGIGVELIDQLFAAMIVKADVIVAHNIKFDLGMVEDNLPVSFDVLKEKEHFCTMIKSKEIVGLAGIHGGGYKFPRLAEAYRHFFNEDFANAHDAMADVRACRDVYFALTDPKPTA